MNVLAISRRPLRDAREAAELAKRCQSPARMRSTPTTPSWSLP